MADKVKIEFDPNSITKNAVLLERYYGLEDESEVPVLNFTITNDSGPHFVEVGPGKYKSAMIFLHLVEEYGDGQTAEMTPQARAKARHGFTHDLCAKAIDNPETEHTSIYQLFRPGKVILSVTQTTQ